MSDDPLREARAIYCMSGCDACRDYAREMGVPLVVSAPTALAQPAPPLDVERLAAEIDRHWMDWDFLGQTASCSCGGWQFDLDRDLVVGEHFAPFSRHIAEAVLAESQP